MPVEPQAAGHEGSPAASVQSPPSSSPAVTVVIPTRGRPELVRKAVEGVVAQRYGGDIHCVVVHDQEPPDRALADLSSPNRVITTIVNDGAPGLAGSRNAGLRRATTDIVASCDDDDAWLPDKLRLQVDRLLRHPEMLVVGAGIRLLMPHGRVVEWLGPSDVVTQRDLLRSRRKELHSSTLVMRRAVFERAGEYDESLPQSYAEDYEWLLRASRLGPIGVVRAPLADIKKDGQSWFRERAEVVAEALQYMLQNHPELRRSRRGHARIQGQVACAKATLDERRQSLTWVRRSLSTWPFAPQAYVALVQLAGVDPRWLLKSARRVGRGLA
jgi:glycosyltransferase involved in cell wall biosynthesis